MSTQRRAWILAALFLLAAIPATACQRVARIIPGNGLAGRAEGTPAPVAPGSPGGATAIPDAQLALSIVQIQATNPGNGQPQVVRSGSGVIVDGDQRLILTSYGVVQPFRADGTPAYGTILVSTNRRLGDAPTREFEADLVSADPANGIAVLRVMRDAGSGSLSAGRFNLPPANLGDARAAAAGLPIRLLGHPAADNGGPARPLLISKASITGIRGTPGVTNRTWLKTDVRLPHGTSGGGAFNQSGALIGILAQDRYLPSAEVGELIPLELAQPVIDRAKKETARYQAPILMQTNAPGSTTQQPTDTMWISAPVFGANAIQTAVSRDLFDYGTRFAVGGAALYYEYVLEGVPNGTIIEERWYLDNVPQDSLSSSYRWDGRGFAIQGDRIAAPGSGGMPRGRWRIEIWAAGALRSQATALIGVDPKEPKVTVAGSGAAATADGRPQAPVVAASTQALVFFEFTGMEGVQTLEWLVFHNNQRVYTSPVLRWDYGDSGRAWVGYAPGRALGSGKWEIELHADGRVLGVIAVVVP
ncbi:MAG: serine protease [Dehalococcoidia bacterium]